MSNKTELKLYVLHKNKNDEWGMWREYYKNGTACYWQEASPEDLRYLNGQATEKRKQKYIQEKKKLYERCALEPFFQFPR